jgi:hypothetical protein
MTMQYVGRVERVEEDRTKGVMRLRGTCTCKWRSDTLEAPIHGSAQLEAPATNQVARWVSAHFQQRHPELSQ